MEANPAAKTEAAPAAATPKASTAPSASAQPKAASDKTWAPPPAPPAARPRKSSLLVLSGYALLALGLVLLIDQVRSPLAPLLRSALPGVQLVSFKKLSGLGAAVNLIGLGVTFNHQGAVAGRRAAIGALCGLASATALLFYLSYAAGGLATPDGLSLSLLGSLAAPLACAALLAYALGAPHPPSASAVTSWAAALHAGVALALGAYSLLSARGVAKALVHPLLGWEGVEGGLYFATALALASATLHAGVNDSKAAATQMCAAGTMAAAWVYLAMMKPKAGAVVWPVSAFYTLVAALGAAEASLLSQRKVTEQEAVLKAATARVAASASAPAPEAKKDK
jgi:hypothetical protein